MSSLDEAQGGKDALELCLFLGLDLYALVPVQSQPTNVILYYHSLLLIEIQKLIPDVCLAHNESLVTQVGLESDYPIIRGSTTPQSFLSGVLEGIQSHFVRRAVFCGFWKSSHLIMKQKRGE